MPSQSQARLLLKVTCPVFGQAQPELTPSKRQKTGTGNARGSFHYKDPIFISKGIPMITIRPSHYNGKYHLYIRNKNALMTMMSNRLEMLLENSGITRRVSTLMPGQHGWHLVDGILKLIFFNENVGILIQISPEVVSKNSIDNTSAMVQVMVRCHEATSHYLNQYWPWCMMELQSLNVKRVTVD